MRERLAVLAALSLGLAACSRSSAPPAYAQQRSSLPPPPVLPPAPMPNVAAMQQLQGQVACAPREMAPGVWVTFDCGPITAVRKAIAPTFKRSFVTGPLPPFVDHRMTGLEGPVKNQGAVGTCTAVSLSSAMDHAIRKMGRGDVTSALHVWSKYAVSSMGVAGDETEGERIALEQSWPYDPAKACKLLRQPFDSCNKAYGVSSGSGDLDPALRSEKQGADGMGRYTISAIEQLQSSPPDLNEMSAVLAGGDAIWIAFHVSDAWNHKNHQSGAVIPDYDERESTGHAVLLAGYRTTPSGGKQFLIHNSWGTKWGDGGYAWIEGVTVSKQTRSAYKVRVSDGGGGPGPNPNPGSNACPAGQAPDSVLGGCVALCASGSAPAAGVCLPTIPGMPGGLPSIPGMPAPGSLPLPLPFPIPGVTPSQPAPQACAQGQVADMLSGQCSAPCPSGGAPLGGLCAPTLPR